MIEKSSHSFQVYKNVVLCVWEKTFTFLNLTSREGVKEGLKNLIVADTSIPFWPPPRAVFADTEKKMLCASSLTQYGRIYVKSIFFCLYFWFSLYNINRFRMVENVWFWGEKFKIAWYFYVSEHSAYFSP